MMQCNVNREELAAIAAGTVPERMRESAQSVLDGLANITVLSDLFPIGLAEGNSEDAMRRFASWEASDKKVYASERLARESRPTCFQDVCTEWGRAGYVSRDYRLADGRTVRKYGVHWDVPEPGGADVCFFFV